MVIRSFRQCPCERRLGRGAAAGAMCGLGILLWFCVSSRLMCGQELAAKNDSIHGTVVNRVTHEAVGHALVYSPDERFGTMTDSDGHFEFTFPNEINALEGNGAVAKVPTRQTGAVNPPYTLMARKPGFLTESGRSLNLESGPKEITIWLVPEALITGHIALPTADAPDRLQVEIYRREIRDGRPHWVQAGNTNTRSNGEFRFADLPAGIYRLLTRELLDRDPKDFAPGGQVYGYPPVYYPSAPDFAAAGTIELAAGVTKRIDVSLVRQPYYPVRIPVANVPPGVSLNVVVSVLGRKGPGYALGYNRGEQRIEGLLPAGTYKVEVQSFAPVAAAGATTITVQGRVEGPSMTLSMNPPIEVKVTEEFTSQQSNDSGVIAGGSRGPQRYLNLYLEPADDFEQGGSASLRPPSNPDDESLVLEHILPGRYWVQPTAIVGYVAAMTSGVVDLLREPLVVPVGRSLPPIEVRLRDDNASIEVTVESAANVPVQEAPGAVVALANQAGAVPGYANVYCMSTGESTGYFAQTNIAIGAGQVASIAVPPGVYRLLAFSDAQQDLEFRNPEAMRAYDGKGPVVRVAAGEKQRVQVPLIQSNE